MWIQCTLTSMLMASLLWLGCSEAPLPSPPSQGADNSGPERDASDLSIGSLDVHPPAERESPSTPDASDADANDGPGSQDTAAGNGDTLDHTLDISAEERSDTPLHSDTSGLHDDAHEAQSSQDIDDNDIEESDTQGDAFSAGDDTSTLPAEGINALCFSEFLDPAVKSPDYDQFDPIIGAHCLGTNHQAITSIEQVVILGDSVTQGTPNDVHPTCLENEHFFRNILSEWLADTFGLDTGDLISWGLFKSYNCLYDGTAGKQSSGDFRNCSKWGARNDDFISGGGQIPECFPGYPNTGSDKTTLVFFTMGGNDVAHINKKGADASSEEVAAGYPSVWAAAESAIGYLEEAMAFLKDPAAFPAGVHVVFANPFEFTDGTGDTSACSPAEITIPFVGPLDISAFGIDLAGLAGYGPWEDQSAQEAIIIWMMEQYMRIAVDYQADLVWLLESFCGHGFVATGPNADTDNRCYRGPDAELYFDISCTHPSKAGHKALSELFKAVITE